MYVDDTLDAARAYLSALDLDYISQYMGASTYPLDRWPADLAAQCQVLYKRFLWLNRLYPQQTFVPTRDIDEYWHNHILHTKTYVRDCQQLFGRYLHHQPAQAGAQDELGMLFEQTKAVYRQVFGENLRVLVRY